MTEGRSFTLQQVDQACGDLYAISDDLEFIKEQLARLPTRKEMGTDRVARDIGDGGARSCGIEALFR